MRYSVDLAATLREVSAGRCSLTHPWLSRPYRAFHVKHSRGAAIWTITVASADVPVMKRRRDVRLENIWQVPAQREGTHRFSNRTSRSPGLQRVASFRLPSSETMEPGTMFHVKHNPVSSMRPEIVGRAS